MQRAFSCFLCAAAAAASVSCSSARREPASAESAISGGVKPLSNIKHFVVIYEENHSFDNLYGGWEGVRGLADADASHTTQLNRAGAVYGCLKQNDVNLKSPPLPADCVDAANGVTSHFTNGWFTIDDFIPATATTCPSAAQSESFVGNLLNGTGEPGGCTRDLVHRFYQEQYQLNGGQQNRYVTGSDAIGLSMGVYDTTALPIYQYLHEPGHPRYAIADNFFQSAFGGSFLNHQWLIAAASPTWPGAAANLHSIVDAQGMPRNNYPLYITGTTVRDAALTVACPSPVPGLACGDYAVNTIQPTYAPFRGGPNLPPQTHDTIGDRLSAAGIDWAWYAGGWSNANGNVGAPGWTNGNGPSCADPHALSFATWPSCPDQVFQFHHQPFNYFAAYAPGTDARAQHLRDEAEFIALAQSSSDRCNLKPVSFVKPIGQENEHPGYASEPNGSNHLVDLLRAIDGSACREDTMIVVTYDEFGGAWDHVPPPGLGGTEGPHDSWGPGTRIPTLILSPHLKGDFVVDHTQYDTTSVLKTLEDRYGLAPLGARDAAVNSLEGAFRARGPFDGESE
jgi:phospholipase C